MECGLNGEKYQAENGGHLGHVHAIVHTGCSHSVDTIITLRTSQNESSRTKTLQRCKTEIKSMKN
jgi:hypothetical protein